MSAILWSRVAKLLLLCTCLQWVSSDYQIPDVSIQALSPKGLRASIPDVAGISIFVFQANVNSGINKNDVGDVTGEIIKATNGRWVFEDRNVQLKAGDLINYYVYVSVNGVGYIKDNLSFRVTALEDLNIQPSPDPIKPSTPQGECQPSETKIHFGVACAGQVIFHEDFDLLREDIWHIEQYIPLEQPDFPFNSYQRSAVTVENGILKIRASPQEQQTGFDAESIYSGTLNLYNGCSDSAESCYVQASGANILPPVVAGKITSRTSFAFKYGVVEIRAKLPRGDWLYPDMLLEPLIKKYGSINEASGVLKMAAARGNAVLYGTTGDRRTEYDHKLLYGGPIINTRCRDALLFNKTNSDGKGWGDYFHVYSAHWSPEAIVLKVDGAEWGRVEPTPSGLRGRLPVSCREPSQRDAPAPRLSSYIAPFDHEFYLTLGLSAGGVTEFKDNLKTLNDEPKPWRNGNRKAVLHYWQAMDKWLPTWTQPELQVDYIKVYAL